MDDGAALLKSILTQPAEDTPRLVYADWLDERGQYGDAERAEFIRVQVELARLDRDPDAVTGRVRGRLRNKPSKAFRRRSELCDRERELREMMVPRHVPGKNYVARRTMGRAFFSECGEVLSGYSLERGFLNLVSLPTDRFLASAEAIFRSHPVTTVRLTDREPDLEYMTDGDPGRIWVRETRDEDGSDIGEDASILPAVLFDLLPGDKTGGIWTAPTEADAYAALSDVCVSWGRQLAELPPLPASGAAHFS